MTIVSFFTDFKKHTRFQSTHPITENNNTNRNLFATTAFLLLPDLT